MPLSSRLGFGLALSLVVGLGAPVIVPAISDNASTRNSFASSLAQTQTAQAQTPAFSDVSADYWAHDYIAGLAKFNVISGFGDGTFRPNEPVTRAQFAAILRQAFLTSQPTTAQAFKDVPANYWATSAIASARSAGFLSGYPDNTFKPNDRILRVQALVSLANGLKYPAGNPQVLSSYKDADTVPTYARPSTAAAAQANLVVSYPAPGQISPNRAASRAEVAAFVYQALFRAGRVEPIAAKPEKRWQITPTMTIPAEAYFIKLSENGQRLAAITTDPGQNIKIWNTQTGSLLRTVIPEESDSVFTEMAISQDGTKIAAVERILPIGEPQLTVRSVEDGRVLINRPLNPSQGTNDLTDPYLSYVVFSPDDKQVITQVAVWETKNDPDPYTFISNRRLDFQNIATGEVTQPVELLGPSGITGATFSPDGKLLAGLRSTDENANGLLDVSIWRRNQNGRFDFLTALPATLDEFGISGITFTNSNLLSLTTGKNYETRLDTWNPQTGEKVQSMTLPNDKCLQIGIVRPSPDGTSYFSSYPDLVSCLGNIQNGEFQKKLDGSSKNSIESGVFSGDGDFLAVADGSKIRIFTKAAP